MPTKKHYIERIFEMNVKQSVDKCANDWFKNKVVKFP